MGVIASSRGGLCPKWMCVRTPPACRLRLRPEQKGMALDKKS